MGACFGCFYVEENTRGVVEKLGKFSHVAGPGLHWAPPCLCDVRLRVDLRVQQLTEWVDMYTRDSVSVRVGVALQFRVMRPEDEAGGSVVKKLRTLSLCPGERMLGAPLSHFDPSSSGAVELQTLLTPGSGKATKLAPPPNVPETPSGGASVDEVLPVPGHPPRYCLCDSDVRRIRVCDGCKNFRGGGRLVI
eukprot:RCo035064